MHTANRQSHHRHIKDIDGQVAVWSTAVLFSWALNSVWEDNIITVYIFKKFRVGAGGRVTGSIHEVEAGESQGPGKSRLHRKTLSQQMKTMGGDGSTHWVECTKPWV